MNRFATAAYRELAAGSSGNLIFSPFNIATALSMVLAGARGETANHIEATLGQAWPEVASLAGDLRKGTASPSELSIANALWVEDGYPLESAFRQIVEGRYGAPLRQVDFVKAAEHARGEINSWTERETKGKIRELIAPGLVGRDTVMVLTSAIYFNGKWVSVFRPSGSQAARFYTHGKETVDAVFMNQTGWFRYGKTATVQVLEMKYAGTSLVFDVFLPVDYDGLAALEKSLTAAKLAEWLGAAREQDVEVYLPKFRAESAFSLREQLSRMGMADAFGPGADFSGMDGRRDLVLAEVIHKAYVEVTEQGTVAAAATGVTVQRSVAMANAPEPPVFRADHPFLFAIRDSKSGAIVFEGRVTNPKS